MCSSQLNDLHDRAEKSGDGGHGKERGRTVLRRACARRLLHDFSPLGICTSSARAHPPHKQLAYMLTTADDTDNDEHDCTQLLLGMDSLSSAFLHCREEQVYPSPFEETSGRQAQDQQSAAPLICSSDTASDSDGSCYGPPLPPEFKQKSKRRRDSCNSQGLGEAGPDDHFDSDEPQCSVCLSPYQTRTSVSPCFRKLAVFILLGPQPVLTFRGLFCFFFFPDSFCLHCINQWATISRKCPQCRQIFSLGVVHDRGRGHESFEFPEWPPRPAARARPRQTISGVWPHGCPQTQVALSRVNENAACCMHGACECLPSSATLHQPRFRARRRCCANLDPGYAGISALRWGLKTLRSLRLLLLDFCALTRICVLMPALNS